ncbi:MAG: ParB/RepB/Spo0J family partition protein [Clostridia bacterium]|nr:ParB/RepB/Spo0J family partition protein [Clostridia bacterium]
MATKKLGKGLSALLSIYDDEQEEEVVVETAEREFVEKTSAISELPIEDVVINPNQPRKNFEEGAMAELAESVRQHGVIQPIVVNDLGDGRYMIIAGERRYRAARMVGLKTVPCVVKSYTERQVKEVAIIENLQREDLNPIEAARAIKQLMDEYNFSQDIVADRIGKSRPAISHLVRLLNLSPEVILLVEQNLLSAGHARNLVVIEDKALQYKVARMIIDKKMSVREVEKLVRQILRPTAKKVKKEEVKSPELIEFEENLQRVFATKVSIQGNDKKGRIMIDYFSKDDLDRIYDLLELINNKKLTLQDLQNYNKHQV